MERRPPLSGLPEIWGGLECTINRVGDQYRDQFNYSGHYQRPDDLEKIAGLGIKMLRYPVLWEKHVQHEGDEINWSWTEKQIAQMKSLGVEPIVGLVHHGSGPSFTSLLDEAFPQKLADYARQVAQKFPHVRYYTPVNEPLTTARFSGQYGWWYPHRKDQKSFVRMLLNQCAGIVLAMKEIRKVNPEAMLVQTEDLGKTYGTSLLKYQLDFENERRWFSLDLLCGKITRRRKIWGYFKRLGVTDEALDFFTENVTVPDIMGFNYYITSERYLDHRVSSYPGIHVGGNGKHRYVDVEAIRVPMKNPSGPEVLLEEAWNRYQVPLAITEVHIGCTREEQMRWLKEMWNCACTLRSKGVDIRAITPWSLLGSFDWNSLLTREQLHYETGVFDISSGGLRATALAGMISGLAKDQGYNHPLLEQKGWWRRDLRLFNPVSSGPDQPEGQPLLIIGKHGSLARAFARICQLRSIPAVSLSRKELNILDPASILTAIHRHKPWAVINCAGFTDIEKAELEPELCRALNTEAPVLLAETCRTTGLPFMSFSADLVFNGEKKDPYTEGDRVQPLNIYGATKAAAEEMVMKSYPDSLIIRSSAFFGPWDQYNFVYSVLRSQQRMETLELPDDVIISPTYLPDLVHASLDLLIDEAKGIWHVTNKGIISWADFALEVVRKNHGNELFLHRRTLDQMGWRAMRPAYSVLGSEKGPQLPTLENALERYFREAVAV